MNAREHEMIQRHVDGCATADEAAALERSLKESAELRALYLDYMNLDVALGAVADAAAVEERTGNEMPVAPPFRFRWRSWAAAAAACLALVLIVGLTTHRQHPPAWPDVAAAIESAKDAIARMPAPSPQPDFAALLASSQAAVASLSADASSPLPAWMSPTASLLKPPHRPSIKIKQPL